MPKMPPPPRMILAGACLSWKNGTKTCDQTCGEHVSGPSGLVFTLYLSFHSVAVGFAILCSRRWILVNSKVTTVAFSEKSVGIVLCLMYFYVNIQGAVVRMPINLIQG